MLKILGAGLPRTGTKSLCSALGILGYNAVHHQRGEVPLFPDRAITRGWISQHFDGIDAATDCPAAMYWREICLWRECKVILTVRDIDGWWESIKRHANTIRVGADMAHIQYTDTLHSLLFGCAQPHEYWWKRRYVDHNEAIRDCCSNNLLMMDIVAGDKWETLCPFLGVDEPNIEWPWENRTHAE